jgi:ADP-ribose pyrophosphatase YjhB (NUDIX family)
MSGEPIDIPVRLRDRVLRLAYRCAYRILSVGWLVRGATARGVRCVLRDERGRVLLVRHAYGDRRWMLPGGRLRRSESAAKGGAREIAEELRVDADGLEPLGEPGPHERRWAREIHMVEGTIDAGVRPRAAEIAAAVWCDPADLPEPVTPETVQAVRLAYGRRDG